MRRTLSIGTLALAVALFGCGNDGGDRDEGTTDTTGFVDCVESGRTDCTVSDEDIEGITSAVECVESDGEDC